VAKQSFQIYDTGTINARFRKVAIWSVILLVVGIVASELLGYIDLFEGVGRPPSAEPH
jgi:hypothetical protein